MITTVSICLYLAAMFFAAITGVTAEQFKYGRATATDAKFEIVMALAAFILAVILQVFG